MNAHKIDEIFYGLRFSACKTEIENRCKSLRDLLRMVPKSCSLVQII